MSDILGDTTRTRENHCRVCGYKLDAATPAGDNGGPEEGSISLCIECSAISVFNADMTLRPLHDGEWEEIPEDKRAEINRARSAIRQVKRKRELARLSKNSQWN